MVGLDIGGLVVGLSVTVRRSEDAGFEGIEAAASGRG